MISATMVMTASRDAELSAIDLFSGCSRAVMDSTERSTRRAVIPTLITKSRTGRKATEGNTNGASCAGVVTAAPQSQVVERQTPDRPIGGPPSVSHVTLELPKG